MGLEDEVVRIVSEGKAAQAALEQAEADRRLQEREALARADALLVEACELLKRRAVPYGPATSRWAIPATYHVGEIRQVALPVGWDLGRGLRLTAEANLIRVTASWQEGGFLRRGFWNVSWFREEPDRFVNQDGVLEAAFHVTTGPYDTDYDETLRHRLSQALAFVLRDAPAPDRVGRVGG